MDWNRIEGNWKQFKGRAKEKWGRLTDDDLDVVNGRRDQLEGKIQERYGLANVSSAAIAGHRNTAQRRTLAAIVLVRRVARTPMRGYAATREAAMAAWRRA
jgi:uncharacterized protein YjbJ (UPF0337 family)